MIDLSEGDLNGTGDANVGADRDIGYPGVYTCVTVTAVLEGGHLVGSHLAWMWSSDKIERSLDRMLELKGATPLLSLFIVGMLTKSWDRGMYNKFTWSNGHMANLFRARLHHTGPVWAFDTSGCDAWAGTDTVRIEARTVGAGTHAALIDVVGEGVNRFLRPHEFTAV